MSATWLVALLVAASTSWSCGLDHGPPGQETPVARLPLDVVPTHYELELAPYFQREGDFQALDVDGQVTIRLTLQGDGTDTITLHAGDSLTIEAGDIRVRIAGDDGTEQEYNVTAVEWDPDNEMVNVSLGRLVSGELSLVVPFLGRLRTDMDGFYLSEYQAAGETKYLAATQFAPMSARKAFPCFDEPALKANFSLTVYPPAGYGVLSNTAPAIDTGDSSTAGEAHNSRRTLPSAASRPAVRFATTRPMPTYLVGVVVYDAATFTADDPSPSPSPPLRVWSRADTADQRGLARDVAAAALDYLGGLFPDYFQNMAGKLDQVAVPDFYFGAMENWGLVTYRERAMLTDETQSSSASLRYAVITMVHVLAHQWFRNLVTPDFWNVLWLSMWERAMLTDEAQSSSASLRYAVTTMVHELAHQWFGDLVTPDFWNVLWLKEGFATYWAYHTDLGLLTDCWRLRELFLVEQLAVALDADASATTHALTSAPDTAALYDDISYSKGGSILRMLSNWLGEDQFNNALNTYLLNRMYDSALPEDLFAAVREEGDPLLADFFEVWTSTPGYPVVSVSRQGRSANLTQERYLLTPTENATGSAPWPTLVSYMVGLDFEPTAVRSVWIMGDEPTTIDDLVEGQPLFLNLNWTGFFRVNYDADGWRLIRDQLESDHLAVPRETRAQLVCDAFSLARSDHLGYGAAFNLSLYLTTEEDYLPWAATFRAWDFLDTALISTTHYPFFQFYVRYLQSRLSWTLTFSPRPDDDHATRSLRAGMSRWLCRAGEPSCQDHAWQLASGASSPGASGVDPDMRAAVYCVWAKDSGRWDWLWRHYLATTTATEKQEVLVALGCSWDEQILTTYLSYTLDKDKIKPQDAQTVFTAVFSTPVGVKVATDFIINNAEAFAKGRYAEKIITGLAKKITTEEQLTKLRSLRSLEALHQMNATVDTAIATAAAQVEWVRNHMDAIADWLEGGNVPPSEASTLSHNMAAVLALSGVALVLLSSTFLTVRGGTE